MTFVSIVRDQVHLEADIMPGIALTQGSSTLNKVAQHCLHIAVELLPLQDPHLRLNLLEESL
jgi:hypothetical protein